MNCEHYREQLPARERGELTPQLQAALAAHLQGCEACARAAAALHELNALLDVDVAPSPGLRRQVVARLEQEAARRGTFTSRAGALLASGFARFWPSRPLGAFTYSLALVLCGMFGGQLLPGGALGMGGAVANAQYQLCPVPDVPRPDIL